jgi:hypothetical protein
MRWGLRAGRNEASLAADSKQNMTDNENHTAAEIYRHTDILNVFHLSSTEKGASCDYLAFLSVCVHILINFV